ncbi:hypothetical protein D3C87_2036090 [compost metagenome]
MPTPPAAMSPWNLAICLLGTPLGDMPSLVADLMKRLRSVSGPMVSGLKGDGAMA